MTYVVTAHCNGCKYTDCVEVCPVEAFHEGPEMVYINPESCIDCNACVEECPVNIDPLSIIMDMRRYLVMEQSAAPQELNMMMTNVENNGAMWQYNQMDRLNWANED